MKMTALTLFLTVATISGFAQGTVSFFNGVDLRISTNGQAVGFGIGNTDTNIGAFYYALFTAPSTVTNIDASLQGLFTSTWTYTGLMATNTSIAGNLFGGNNVATATGWPVGVTNSFLVAGWSANEGTTVQQFLNNLVGAQHVGSGQTARWFANVSGPGLSYIGASTVGFGMAGGGTEGLPPALIFGTGPNPTGTPVMGFTLDIVAIPEPSTLGLAGLGTLALLIFRRRK